MTNWEMIRTILETHSCLTALQIVGFVNRQFGIILSPQAVAGALRSKISDGLVVRDKNFDYKTIYWLKEEKGWIKI